MTIELKIALRNASCFLDIGSIVDNAKENISFFGGRYIYADGYNGSVDIDAIAARFIALQGEHFEPTEEEREIGKKSISKITQLYENNYSRKRNILTRIFCATRDCFRNIYYCFFSKPYFGIKGLWYVEENSRDQFFDSYTPKQFEETFNRPPRTNGLRPRDPICSICPERFYRPNYRM